MAITGGKWVISQSTSGLAAVRNEITGELIAQIMTLDDAKLLCAAKDMRKCLQDIYEADETLLRIEDGAALQKLLASLPPEGPTQAERDAATKKLIELAVTLNDGPPNWGTLGEMLRYARIAKGE